MCVSLCTAHQRLSAQRSQSAWPAGCSCRGQGGADSGPRRVERGAHQDARAASQARRRCQPEGGQGEDLSQCRHCQGRGATLPHKCSGHYCSARASAILNPPLTEFARVCASADKANAQVLTVRALLKAGAAAGQSGNREQTALHIAAADVIKVKHVAAWGRVWVGQA